MAHLKSPSESEQIEHILRSHVFQGAETLARLLRYLAEKSHEEPGTALKEYRIATEVFGRKDDFDPRSDSSVRVQVARLRSKLLEYAVTEGIHDTVVVEIPKGAYKVTFTHAHPGGNGRGAHAESSSAESSERAAEPLSSEERETSLPPPPPWRILTLVLAGLLAVSLLWAGYLWHAASARPGDKTADPALHAFWDPFLKGSDDRWVVFSNATFVGHPDKGMRYYRPREDSAAEIQDHYTGVGEVLSVHELDAAFNSLRAPLRVKRGALLSMDDVKNTNVIFVGAPVENLTLNDIPTTRYFKLQPVAEGPRQGDVQVLNLHPEDGEPASYINAPEHPITDDYAIIARLPGLEPTRQIIIAAGTTTIGTQAAVEYICHADTLRTLLADLGRDNETKPFEAVLHIKVARGVPVASQVVNLRLLPEKK